MTCISRLYFKRELAEKRPKISQKKRRRDAESTEREKGFHTSFIVYSITPLPFLHKVERFGQSCRRHGMKPSEKSVQAIIQVRARNVLHSAAGAVERRYGLCHSNTIPKSVQNTTHQHAKRRVLNLMQKEESHNIPFFTERLLFRNLPVDDLHCILSVTIPSQVQY